ncbi:uncharacterized protein LOC103575376 [Microplitis demolitor]|uniref:uncharacterized protein LOC103575376 n=1 Tax=Microplitis demolitor TaxID=69319 RepID=UPI00235B6743|nr:uncharacterized protein LOC103575376 [Microplitis demolitor]
MNGIKYLLTTPYHSQANGLVERLHRQLKSALLCHKESWYDALPAVLEGLRASWKHDIQTTTNCISVRNLSTCSPVLVRNDQVGPSFEAPYEDPYRVITRHDKYFIVDFRGRQIAIPVDRLKPAYEANPIDMPMTIANSHPNSTATETQKRRVRYIIFRVEYGVLMLR